MASDWTMENVLDLQREGVLHVEDGNHGEYRPRPDEFCTEGFAFIRASDMNGGNIQFTSAGKINDTALRRIRKGVGKPGDVLFSHKGTVGKLALVPDDAPPFVCSPQTTFWRSLDENRLDRRYLYCFMRSMLFRNQYQCRKGETDMADYVSLTAQRTFHLAIPPIAEQREIGRVLGQLDDKIELNRRMNETLEAVARAIFRSWFVDFDPVVAKVDGHQPYGLSAETAALFPEHFEESELGPIPAGWTVEPVGDAVRCVGGGTPRTNEKKYWEAGVHPFATPRDMSKLQSTVMLDTERHITDAGVAKISSGQLPAGTVLLSSRAPIGYLAIAEVPVSVNQGIIAMICDKVLSNYYMLHWTCENMDEILSRAGGTTFAEISKRNFRPIPALIPSSPVLDHLNSVVGPLHQRMAENARESNMLARIRDTLLPKLLSGELRVGRAEKVTEEVMA